MVQQILVDTDVLIDTGRAVEVTVVQLETAAQNSTLAVSIITQIKLVVGCRNRTELQIMERFLERFEIIKLS